MIFCFPRSFLTLSLLDLHLSRFFLLNILDLDLHMCAKYDSPSITYVNGFNGVLKINKAENMSVNHKYCNIETVQLFMNF